MPKLTTLLALTRLTALTAVPAFYRRALLCLGGMIALGVVAGILGVMLLATGLYALHHVMIENGFTALEALSGVSSALVVLLLITGYGIYRLAGFHPKHRPFHAQPSLSLPNLEGLFEAFLAGLAEGRSSAKRDAHHDTRDDGLN